LFSILVSSLLIELAACILRIIFLKKLSGLSVKMYWQSVFSKIIFPLLAISTVGWLCVHFLDTDFRFIITFGVSLLCFAVTVFFFGLSVNETAFFRQYLSRFWIIGKKQLKFTKIS